MKYYSRITLSVYQGQLYFTLMLTTVVCLPFVLHDNLFHLLSEGCHLRLLIRRKEIKKENKIIFWFWFSHLKSNIPQQLQDKVNISCFHLSSAWFYTLEFLKFNKAEFERLTSYFSICSVIWSMCRSYSAIRGAIMLCQRQKKICGLGIMS